MVIRTDHISKSCIIIENTLEEEIDVNSRIAIVGIGNEFRYDDAAGLEVVRNLNKKLKTQKPTKTILLVEGETAPHGKINEIIDWNPTHLIMLDSAELNKPPGTIEFVRKEEMHQFSTTSHSGSKTILLDFLIATLKNLKIFIIGIQVEKIIYEKGISESVQKAIEQLTEILVKLLF
ncbi:MAG: hydrogenase maturation protease [Candidatus Helarchaeota archaeon]